MILSEEEAKTKWCPMFNCAGGLRETGNAAFDGTPRTMCVASRCMMWRWWEFDKRGYCGLAGAVEN